MRLILPVYSAVPRNAIVAQTAKGLTALTSVKTGISHVSWISEKVGSSLKTIAWPNAERHASMLRANSASHVT
jgi:hypothetical protein